jgi:aromatic-L-amino-acid/L-tryptophan decarboxylase
MSFVDDGTRALDWVASYRDRVDRLPVLSQVQPGQVRAQLPRSAPEHGLSLESLLEDMDRVILPGITHWQSPRFFAYFSTTGSEPGVIGELLTAALNNVGILWRTSPALQELEETVLAWLAELIGLPAGWHGHLEEGASLSTLAALAAAREAKPGARVVVCSEHAHSSVDKACRLLELELRKTPADEAFRLRPELLNLTDACAVVATVGTTSSTSVDPVREIADACERAGVWLHVDAAYAGSAMVCPELRWAFDGIERVDSLVVNPHKWLLTPQGCSAFWTRRPEALRAAFGLVPEYLRTPDEVVSFSEYSPELGRPFRALKLWAVLRHYGGEGLRARIRAGMGLAQAFEALVRDEPGWELCAPRPFSVVCFRRIASDDENAALMARVNATGEIFLSHTKLNGRYVMRMAFGNERTTIDDVRRAWDVLRSAAATLG